MADFNIAIPIVLRNEGGYVWDANDSGGETKYGISKRSYPNLDIKNLNVAQATVIYLKDFWKFGGINDQDVANKLFDSYVNMKHIAIKLIQRLVNVPQDGEYGPATERAINQYDPGMLLAHFKESLINHYQNIVKANPAEGKFLVGWLRRAQQ